MDSLAKVFQYPFNLRSQQRPRPPLFGENGDGTTTHRKATIEACLQKACTLPRPDSDGRPRQMASECFVHIQTFLHILDNQHKRGYPDLWSLRPRIYTILRAIGALDLMDEFVKHHIYDISIPFDHQTLPQFLSDPTVRQRFLATQACVLTDARRLEDSSEDHIYFSGTAEEHIVHHCNLGNGGFGYVDVVLSRLSARSYARKRVARGPDNESNRRAQQYVVDEIRLMKTLRHRHLTKIIQSYSDQKYIAFLMEPIADGNLLQFLSKKPFPEARLMALRQFFGCLASGVDYLHQKKIRHHDLKLANVLVKNSQIYIADFGASIAWTTGRGTTQSRGAPATAHYMAPEVDNRQPRHAASDMWSLGIIYLEILTIIKGHTLGKWQSHLEKKATRAGTEAWPCRNLAAVHEWMAVLTSTQCNEWIDDETVVWRDNEPLAWIKSLLETNQDARLSSRALVTTIADSSFCRSFACIDCIEEFTDPQYRYLDAQDWARNSKEVIDAEVTALFGVMADPTEQMDDKKTQRVTTWLGQTQEDVFVLDRDDPVPLAMPGAFTNWVDEERRKTQAEQYVHESLPNAPKPEAPLKAASLSPSPGQALHEGGFFVEQEDDSSDASSGHGGVTKIVVSNGLFPIIYDYSTDSSDSSDGCNRVDSPMIDQIWEDCENYESPEAPSGKHNVNSLSTPPTMVEQRVVRFHNGKSTRYQYVEDDTAIQTKELCLADQTLPVTGPVLELIPTTQAPAKRSSSEMKHSAAVEPLLLTYERANSPIAPLDQSMVNRLLKAPSPTKNKKNDSQALVRLSKQAKSTTGTSASRTRSWASNQSMFLPWHTETDRLGPLDRHFHDPPALNNHMLSPDEVRQYLTTPESIPGDLQNLQALEWPLSAINVTDKRPDESNSQTGHKATSTAEAPKSALSKLSVANVGRLNKQTKAILKPERRALSDDNFTPAEFIEAAWLSAEATDSLATSVMSNSSTMKLRGIKLRWDDIAYSYLERYAKSGNAQAVTLLLDQGCNCGTVTKRRPKPLINAIEGRSARHNKCVRALIKAGTDVNASHRGKTPIHRVLEQPYFAGYQKLLAMLLGAGAELNKPDSTGEYPLTKLFKGAAGSVPLEEYQKDCLALILHPRVQCAVDANVRQPFTLDTPLHQAVRRRTAQAVALLIHNGADVNAKNASGTTPLLVAANQWRGKLSNQQERILRYILDVRGVDLNAKGGTLGRTALHHAASAGCAVALDMLLERGASLKLMDKEGNDEVAILEMSRESGNAAEDYQIMYDLLLEASL